MLSSDEERELARLEASLREPVWRRLVNAVESPVWRHRRKVRALFAFAVVVGVCGGITGSDDVLSLGCLLAALVGAYWFAMFMRDQPGPAPRSSGTPRHPSR